jgi:DNA-directed RNA polymerase subunit RPC12/RpoP
MFIKNCIHCGEKFNLNSPEKNKAGGKSTECPDCSEETVIKYAGVQAADGKQAQATILKFDNEEDKSKYIAFWQNNSGLHKGKSCQLGSHLSTTPSIKFKTVTTFNPTNHKGKM